MKKSVIGIVIMAFLMVGMTSCTKKIGSYRYSGSKKRAMSYNKSGNKAGTGGYKIFITSRQKKEGYRRAWNNGLSRK